MRDSYLDFVKRGAEIVAVGPNEKDVFKNYWVENKIPYIGLPDSERAVSRLYRQEVNTLKLGRMPLNCVIDRDGRIRYIHHGSNMTDIPDNETFISVIDQLNESSK